MYMVLLTVTGSCVQMYFVFSEEKRKLPKGFGPGADVRHYKHLSDRMFGAYDFQPDERSSPREPREEEGWVPSYV